MNNTMPLSQKANAKPVNPHATQAAKHLLDFLYTIQGKYTLSGQHNFIGTGSKYTELVKEITGRYPLVWGSDFSFSYQGDEPQKFHHCGPLNLSDPTENTYFTHLSPPEARQNMVRQAIQKHNEGYIITLMWHACPPNFGDCCDGRTIWTLERRPSQEEWDDLTTEGTPLQMAWKQQADTIAEYLHQLKEADVPILWRPYHEMNGVWFWWCNKPGKNGFQKLWIMMYNHYVNHHHLDNLLWVWNTNAPRDTPGDEAFAYETFWPGHEYVDILAADVYRKDWKVSHHDDLVALAQGKPIALGEVGEMPTPDILNVQNQWAWFMVWGHSIIKRNTVEAVQALYDDDRILTKDDVIRDANDQTWKKHEKRKGSIYLNTGII